MPVSDDKSRIQQIQEIVGSPRLPDGQPRFTIEDRLGRGGMAEVYLATNNKTGGKVAIKVLNDDLSREEEVVARFRREVEIQCQLSHPNIVKAFDVEQNENFHYFFMEYVEGETLDRRLRTLRSQKLRMEIREILKVAKSIAGALLCAHEQGVIHRDLKPSNIQVGKFAIVVMDFGIARVRDTKALSSSFMFLGTPPWMSPEQWAASGFREASRYSLGSVDARTDLYSLGVILYELFTGSNPFMGKDHKETCQLHLSFVPPPLVQVIPNIDPLISRAIEMLLQKHPDQRTGSAVELLELLEEAPTGPVTDPNAVRLTVPSSAIPHRIDGLARKLTPNEEHLWNLVDGVRTVGDVLQQSGIPSAERDMCSMRTDAIWFDIPLSGRPRS